jgi:hypothetical protein
MILRKHDRFRPDDEVVFVGVVADQSPSKIQSSILIIEAHLFALLIYDFLFYQECKGCANKQQTDKFFDV